MAIAFQVTDGKSADDPDGRIATLVLPISVTPRENQPPVFDGGVLEFEPGAERTVQLPRLTTERSETNHLTLLFDPRVPAAVRGE